jgi:hypothetical protein
MIRTTRPAGAMRAAAILLALSAGSAMATTVTATNYTLLNGSTEVQIADSTANVDGSNPTEVAAGTIVLQTSIGTLNAYCADLFNYIDPNTNYTFNQSVLSTSSQYSNGVTTLNFTQQQVNLMTALLINGGMPANTTDTTALQVALWEVEYGTAAANGTYTLGSGTYFVISADTAANPQSAASIAEAQTYLNNVTGYQNGSSFVAASWSTDAHDFVEYLTGASVQNLIYLATPEPSSAAVIGIGLLGLWAAARRRMSR